MYIHVYEFKKSIDILGMCSISKIIASELCSPEYPTLLKKR